MSEKKITVLTLIIYLATTFVVFPSQALEINIINICDPWQYQKSSYEYKLGSTYVTDIYTRKCADGIEFKKERQLFLPNQHYADFFIMKMVKSVIPLPYKNFLIGFTFITPRHPLLNLTLLLDRT